LQSEQKGRVPVNDFLQLPSSERSATTPHVAAGFLAAPPTPSHTVQFYDDDAFLFQTVARFASAGLAAGEHLILIVTPAHARGILGQLDPQLAALASSSGQLTVLDARATLESFMREGLPDAECFRAALEPLLAGSRAQSGRGVRAFGEMVDLLLGDGNPEAALRLEELWETLVAERQMTLAQLRTLQRQQQRVNDPAYVEQLARDKLHFCMTGQTCYVIIGGPGSGSAAAARAGGTPWYDRLWDSVQQADGKPAGPAAGGSRR